jgi:F-type H+-transporting ATPase subunit gamma
MANLLDIRRRIKSVKNTQQITKAMKMVSAAKLKRAQDRVTMARPYAVKMQEVLTGLATQAGEEFNHPLMDPRGDEKYLIVLITADKGLCGAFNTNLIKAAQAFINENQGHELMMIPVGRKGRDFYRRRNMPFAHEYVAMTGRGSVDFREATDMAREVVKTYLEDETIDKVFLIYSEFKSVLQQRVVVDQILPVAHEHEAADGGAAGAAGDGTQAAKAEEELDYIFEQDPGQLFRRLLPKLIETQIYRALLESVASEQGMRMTAMDSASKNANDLIAALTLNMNRIRQAKITNEIIEVVSGAQAS